MRPKKYPNKDLNLKGSLYFVIALLALLALTYCGLEWKFTHNNKGYDLGKDALDADVDQEDATIILYTTAIRQP